MNISLSGNATKKKPKKLNMGLNVLGGDDSDDDDEAESGPRSDSRTAVNKALLTEQAALRKRARAAAVAQDTNIYDYDGAYESFKQKPEENAPKEAERKSRYIGDLVKAAEKRKRERDIAYERKVAREQAAEEADSDFRGKDKFVTAAYKRKLEERKLWQAEEDRKEEEEKANDVTKKTGGLAMANFYGNLNRNVAFGGESDNVEIDDTPHDSLGANARETGSSNERLGNANGKASFTDGFEIASGATDGNDRNVGQGDEPEKDPEELRKRKRIARQKKVKEARERYFQRHGMTEVTQ